MRYLVLICTLLIFYGCTNTTPPTCATIKNGKFYFLSKSKRNKIPFEMHDSVCVRITNEPGKMDTSDIGWKGDCEFWIKGRSHEDPKDSDKIRVALTVKVKILECHKQYFILRTAYTDEEFLRDSNDTLWIAQ